VFTGIVEEVGTIKSINRGQHSAVLTVRAKTVLEETRIGDSIAVNGICLTVRQLFPDSFAADVMHETLNRSALAQLTIGSAVNLERAMPANGRFGGHIVAGHVDGVGRIANIRKDDTAIWYTIYADPAILRYVVEKGSITIDGISLTVAAVEPTGFSVSTIPHTVRQTNLNQRHKGDFVGFNGLLLCPGIHQSIFHLFDFIVHLIKAVVKVRFSGDKVPVVRVKAVDLLHKPGFCGVVLP
jgi:riboflavin synthase